MKTRIAVPPIVEGRVVVGPKRLGRGYARIVSGKNGAGRIESFDPVSRTWAMAPESVTFSEVWSAPVVSGLHWEQVGDKS